MFSFGFYFILSKFIKQIDEAIRRYVSQGFRWKALPEVFFYNFNDVNRGKAILMWRGWDGNKEVRVLLG